MMQRTHETKQPLEMDRRAFLKKIGQTGIAFSTISVLGPTPVPVQAAQDRQIPELVFFSNTQATDPQEYETAALLTQMYAQLGLQVRHSAQARQQMSLQVFRPDVKRFDLSTWRMVGRPERLDPDELLFNLYHSSTCKPRGYNFICYINPEYDRIVEAQRREIDREKRRELVWKCQEILAQDQPDIKIVWPHDIFAYNNQVFENVINAKGLGLKNFWTFIQMTPKGEQKDVIINASLDISAINPLYISGATDSWVTELVWDRVMRMGPDGLPRPWAAETVEWVNETTVEVTLRPGMTFHDGQPVTAEDVKFSFDVPKIKTVPQYTPFVTIIKEVQILDERRVRFLLHEPHAPFFTSTLAKLNIVPKHIWKDIPEKTKVREVKDYQEERPVGSGPFRFVHWKHSEEVALEANPDHWAVPKIGRWIVRIIPNQETTLGLLKSGQINFLAEFFGDPEVFFNVMKEEKHITIVPAINVGMKYIAFNHIKSPFDDKVFRQALAMMTPKPTITKNIYKGYATTADSPVSAALEYWHNPNLGEIWAFNPQKAREHLAQNGYEWDTQGRLLYPKGKEIKMPPG